MHPRTLSQSVAQLISIFSLSCVNFFENPSLHAQTVQEQDFPQATCEPFTGKITRHKVRIRLQPSLDAQILTELDRDTLISIVGEVDEFYAVMPLKDTKAYIFRTLVLDGTVEGNRVNVRLEPALESPVIAQLNQGDRIEGSISALNSKWLEIVPPASARFYVCKEYVEKAGPPSLIQELEKRTVEVERQLKRAYADGKKELLKNFDAIHWDRIVEAFNHIIQNYTDFPAQVAKAQKLLADMQKMYLQKKVSHLESLVTHLNTSSQQNSAEEILAVADEPLQEEQLWNSIFDSSSMTAKMAAWIPQEKAFYEQWLKDYPTTSPYQFYQQQAVDQVVLRGMIEPYARVVRNKPGDYLLVNQSNNRPIAYLYSTKVNLQEKVGQEVTLYGLKRANNNFAFPAYFILSIE